MKTTITANGLLQLEEVFNPIVLVTKDGEQMSITMRDSGFEFCYNVQMWFAKGNYVEPFHKSPRDNYLVSELQHHQEETVCENREIKTKNK